MRPLFAALTLIALPGFALAGGLDRPMIADTFFYWYQWDYQREFGSWVQGIWNTPLDGYYDSATYRDNLRSLRTASEWGITDHFMDYWGPGWKGEDGGPREAVVMRAAEELQRRGYDIHMGFYQDGDDFDMTDFAANLDPGRDFRFYVENWGLSPVLPRIDLQPTHMIYGRNGLPQPTDDDAGFRRWLKARYDNIIALNRAWDTDFDRWEDVRLDYGSGVPRADSIRYATEVWRSQWEETERRAREELHVPAPLVSFDAAYRPYRDFGYSALPKSVAGPHSYAGIFSVPHDQDTERFIQAAVAKAYDTVFMDHFKNFYHDVEIRTPGSIYPADFHAFDRFWAGALNRRSEALLHLSWNEWWEGSNLEPCWEYGKTYCEKNLLWSTVMKRCFEDIHNWNEGAKVAVLLNDWLWMTGGQHTEDVYGCVQALRRANVTFDLLPDDFVTRDRLAEVDTVIAPTGGSGLGENAAGERIADVLKAWVSQERRPGAGPHRRLVTSQMPEYLEWLGIEVDKPRGGAKPGPDMNVFIDIGEEGDDEFLKAGSSGREDWGALPEGSFGSVEGKQTRRWTPAVGKVTTFVLPFSPHRGHMLRLQGSAMAENEVTVTLDTREAGAFSIEPGVHEYEVEIAGDVVGATRVAEVKLFYDRTVIPKELDPERFPTENRACNLAIDWVQLSTSNVEGHTTQQDYSFPTERINFLGAMPGALKGRGLKVAWTPRLPLEPGDAAVLSRYASDRAPRDVVAPVGQGEVWYCNGFLGANNGAILRHVVADWAGHEPEWELEGDGCLGSLLSAGGNTRVAVVYNYDAPKEQHIELHIPMTDRSLVEVMALSRDGQALRKLDSEVSVEDGVVTIADSCRYYAAYAISCGPVQARMPALTVTPGTTLEFNVELDNNDPRPTTVRLSLLSPVPTISGGSVGAELTDYEDQVVPFEITCDESADWGKKTVVFDLSASGRHVYLWRKLRVLRRPEPEIATTLLDSAAANLVVRNTEHPLTASGVAEKVRVQMAGKQAGFGNLPSGAEAVREVQPPPPVDAPTLVTRLAELTWEVGGRREEKVQPVSIASYPKAYDPVPAAVAPVLLFNESEHPLENHVVSVPTAELRPHVKSDYTRLYVRDAEARAMPSQVSADGAELLFIADVPARGAATYFACIGEAPGTPTELAVTPEALGSGHGKVTIGNQALELVLAEQAGGTATSLRSLRTNAQYGAGSFGAAYGTWGTYDPLSPRVDTTMLLAGTEHHDQTSAPAKLSLVENGPVRAVARCEWRDRSIEASQIYSVNSMSPVVRVETLARFHRKRKANEELIVLDGKLKRAGLTKIFPNYVGINATFGEDKLQHGWRSVSHVPDVFTAMTPNDFPESVSFVLLERDGIDTVRQGFWPAVRGEVGPCEHAWIELMARQQPRASALVDILLHEGHDPVAREHLDTYRNGPLVIVPKRFTLGEG